MSRTPKQPPKLQDNPAYRRSPAKVSRDGRSFWIDSKHVDDLREHYEVMGIEPPKGGKR